MKLRRKNGRWSHVKPKPAPSLARTPSSKWFRALERITGKDAARCRYQLPDGRPCTYGEEARTIQLKALIGARLDRVVNDVCDSLGIKRFSPHWTQEQTLAIAEAMPRITNDEYVWLEAGKNPQAAGNEK